MVCLLFGSDRSRLVVWSVEAVGRGSFSEADFHRGQASVDLQHTTEPLGWLLQLNLECELPCFVYFRM